GSEKDYLLLRNIHGTENNPIIIKNVGSEVIFNTDHYFGIKIANCSFIKFLGNGEDNYDYGFRILRVGNGSGISIDELSTNIEIAYVEVSNTLIAGLYAKTDPDCTFASSRDNFTMYSLHIHNCYFHDIGDEGMYIGHSKYVQGVFLSDCDTTIYPHVLKDVKVYDNILEYIGWDGIQVSSADEDCSIYNNIIRFDSQKEIIYQMSGILIGGGSKCDCYNNQIYDGKGDGIDVLGLGGLKVFNNLIVRAGKSFMPGNQNEYKHGIYVGDVYTTPGSSFKIYNNTIVRPKSFGITYNNNVAEKGYLYNNLIADPGQKNLGEIAFINSNVPLSKIEVGNNYNAYEIQEVKFENPGQDRYNLLVNSPAVDMGKNLSNEGITFDILNQPRPFNNVFDAGAYEFRIIGIEEISNSGIIASKVFPNPAKHSAWVNVKNNNSDVLTFTIYSLDGKLISTFDKFCSAETEYKIKLNIENLSSQFYILNIKSSSFSVNRSMLID
ncbi:MAG: hypothetical protein C0598_02745, partial [Marinilabiliales bacterium]